MHEDLQGLIQAWDGLAVISRFDKATGSWMFISLHNGTLGPCTGGTRMAVYPQPLDGLRDGMRLARGMTYKWAALDFDYGGGKGVLAVPRLLVGDERRGLLHRYGKLVDALYGGFWTGEDMGTSTEDMLAIAESTRFVHGFDPESGAKLDPSPYTARGVLRGLEAALAEVFGEPSPDGRTVHIQGVGHVGRELARLLVERGARILVSDTDAARAMQVADAVGGAVVAPDQVYSTPCDVYAPCAIGATLNATTIPTLACRAIAGSANNQLAEDDDAALLLEAGIAYVPDYIINAGGALAFGLMSRGTQDASTLYAKVDAIGETVADILREAGERSESPVDAASRRVERVLAAARAAKDPAS